jgi:hypothetical protein
LVEAWASSRIGRLEAFRTQIDAPVTLEDFAGQAGKKMLLRDSLAAIARRRTETGLRFLERRADRISSTIMYPPANWTRSCWSETEKGVAFLQHIEDSVPVLRTVSTTPNDEPHAQCFRISPGGGYGLTEEYVGFLRSLARRVSVRLLRPTMMRRP